VELNGQRKRGNKKGRYKKAVPKGQRKRDGAKEAMLKRQHQWGGAKGVPQIGRCNVFGENRL